MKNKALLLLLSLSLLNVNKSYALDSKLKVLIPLNLLSGALWFAFKKASECKYSLARRIKDNPQENLEDIKDFCANLKTKTIKDNSKGVTSYSTTDDRSLLLKLSEVRNNPEQLNAFADTVVSSLIKKDADGLYNISLLMPVIGVVGSIAILANK